MKKHKNKKSKKKIINIVSSDGFFVETLQADNDLKSEKIMEYLDENNIDLTSNSIRKFKVEGKDVFVLPSENCII